MDFHYIDAHMHFHDPTHVDPYLMKSLKSEFPIIQQFINNPDDNSAILGFLDALNCDQAWLMNYEAKNVIGHPFEINEWVANLCENSDGRLIPFGGIDVFAHNDPVGIMRDFFESNRLFGLKVHPPHQLYKPNIYLKGNNKLRKLYEMCEELKIPVVFHTGSSIFDKARSKYGNPLYLEDILIDFPDLIVIMAHGGRPFWMREAEYLMIKFPQLYFDISGIPPHYIPDQYPRILRYADRLIFGSDFPSPGVPGSRQNAEEIAKMGFSEDILNKILFENAKEIVRKRNFS